MYFFEVLYSQKIKTIKNFKIKNKEIKSLMEEEIPSGTKLNFKHIILITFLSIFAKASYLINVTIIILSPPHNLWKNEGKSIENNMISS